MTKLKQQSRNMASQSEQTHPTAPKSLFLATTAFAIAFANWGLIAGLAPLLKKELGLSAVQTSLMIAIPVLLGSMGRIPAGMLTDRFGARGIFSLLLSIGIIPTLALAINHSYVSLLFWGFFLGIAGSSFAIGVAFVSRWHPSKSQGMATGIYGIGNIGQSIAVFGGPVLAGRIGISNVFVIFGLASLAWAVVFFLNAKNPTVKVRPKTFQECLIVLQTEKLTWVLSLFYALTFGGFISLSIYLPTLLNTIFGLTPADAGARTALFVIVATIVRPMGGWLSDRIGGQLLLLYVFLGVGAIGWLMMLPSMIAFTMGALGCAILFGLGNGATFKLVPQYFPKQVGTVTGLVGAAGGLGGFFPPLGLGMFRELTQSYALGFILLSGFAFLCAFVLGRTFLRLPTPVSN
jgi:MFS transporter, NNP family, nitrate/nitrite transporter